MEVMDEDENVDPVLRDIRAESRNFAAFQNEREALAQVVANIFWHWQGGEGEAKVNDGDRNFAGEMITAGWRSPEYFLNNKVG